MDDEEDFNDRPDKKAGQFLRDSNFDWSFLTSDEIDQEIEKRAKRKRREHREKISDYIIIIMSLVAGFIFIAATLAASIYLVYANIVDKVELSKWWIGVAVGTCITIVVSIMAIRRFEE